MKLTSSGLLEGFALALVLAFLAAAMFRMDRAKPQPIDPGLCHIAGGQVIHTERGPLCSKGTT